MVGVCPPNAMIVVGVESQGWVWVNEVSETETRFRSWKFELLHVDGGKGRSDFRQVYCKAAQYQNCRCRNLSFYT